MYVAGVSVKTVEGYPKNVEEQVIRFRARLGAIYSVSNTKEYLLNNGTIDNRLCFKNQQTLENSKIRIGGRSIAEFQRIFQLRTPKPMISLKLMWHQLLYQ